MVRGPDVFGARKQGEGVHRERDRAGGSWRDGSAPVIVPSEKVFEVKDGKKKSKTRTFFPGTFSSKRSSIRRRTHLILNTPS